MDTEMRKIGKEALQTTFKNTSNINIIEKYIFDNTDKIEYKRVIYQVIGDTINKKKINDILSNIKKQKIGWSHPCFDYVSKIIDEQNEFIINPFNVEEGALRCHKCNSKRVFSYSKQVRSGDEATSIFAQCVNCKVKWVV